VTARTSTQCSDWQSCSCPVRIVLGLNPLASPSVLSYSSISFVFPLSFLCSDLRRDATFTWCRLSVPIPGLKNGEARSISTDHLSNCTRLLTCSRYRSISQLAALLPSNPPGYHSDRVSTPSGEHDPSGLVHRPTSTGRIQEKGYNGRSDAARTGTREPGASALQGDRCMA
jgi:hypothetical protein